MFGMVSGVEESGEEDEEEDEVEDEEGEGIGTNLFEGNLLLELFHHKHHRRVQIRVGGEEKAPFDQVVADLQQRDLGSF